MTQRPASSAASPPLSRRWVLALGVLGAGGAMVAFRGRPGPDPSARMLTVQEAHDRAQAGGLTLIDIRTPREWQATGVPEGAIPLDMRRQDFINQLQRIMAENPAAPVALICARGVRSARMARALSDAGLAGVVDVPEGMLGSTAGPGWLARGLPVLSYKETTE